MVIDLHQVIERLSSLRPLSAPVSAAISCTGLRRNTCHEVRRWAPSSAHFDDVPVRAIVCGIG
jgi:hypothetical protein